MEFVTFSRVFSTIQSSGPILNISEKYKINTRVSLKPYNTFQIEAVASEWTEIHHSDDLLRLMDSPVFQSGRRYILGGGSNVLFTNDFNGLIIKNAIPGINVLSEDEHHVVLKIGAGVLWDNLVRYSLDHNLAGIENLSMIPGLVGAAPIQNIGAYGVELEQTFLSLEARNLENGEQVIFDHGMCQFGYRNSIFKQSLKDKFLITYVTLRLDKQPELTLDYGNLRQTLAAEGVTDPDIHDVSRAVRSIRASKLPDPEVTGNAGSFFKNPVISTGYYEKLKTSWPDMPGFPVISQGRSFNFKDHGHEEQIKVPAAWLIEQCGFKGKRDGDAGVHDKHALILVNYGNATGQQLLDLAGSIQDSVKEHFGISLEPEVNIVS